MKRFFKALSLVLVFVMLLSVFLTGCSSNKAEQKPAETAKTTNEAADTKKDEPKKDGPDLSKEVKLTGYLMGEAPAGMKDVMDKLNERLKKDLNCTMEINYISWADQQSKYPLILAAGENVDWIFTANWCFYAQEAAKGAFKEITDESLQKLMPKHYAAIKDTSAMKEAKVNGKVFMLTTSTPDRKVGATIIREDLRKKYNVPEVNKFSDIEPYLEAIKKNEPGMVPVNIDASFDLGRCLYNLAYENGPGYWDLFKSTTGGSGLIYDLGDPTGKLNYIYDEAVASHLKKAAKTVKSWYEKGYINRNAFANKVRSKDSFDQGKSAVGFGNTMDIQANLAKAKSMNWEVKVIPQLDQTGKYPADPFINNGVAIVAKSKNADRTMMALDLIMEDESYNYLVYFGIEGKNYVLKDGKVGLPDGLAADKNTYPPDAAGFWFTNKDQHKPLATWDDGYVKLRNDVKGMLGKDPFATFTPKTDAVKTEVANINQTITQYFNPVCLGMVKDVDAAFKTLEEKLKAAGIEKLKAEMDKQTKEFIDSQK